MRVLVTGATGFIGSAVVRKLLTQGIPVSVLVRPNSDRTNINDLDVTVHDGDITNQETVTAAMKDCEGLFHLAADYRLWTRDPQELYRNNVEGTRNVMLAAIEAGISKIVYTSSVATLAVFDDGTISDEETPVTLEEMIGHYKRSKFLAERVVDKLVKESELPAIIVNPSTPVGSRDIKPTPTGKLICQASRKNIPAFVDTGLNIVHVDDVAEGHLLAFSKGIIGRRYILGGENMSLKEILTIVANYCGHTPPSLELPRRLIYPVAWLAQFCSTVTDGPEPTTTIDGLKMSKKKMYFSSARAINELGYRFRPSVDAIHEAIDWFKEKEKTCNN